eukprot:549903-Pelagomonas_calceolata.AAC.1
MKEGCPKSPGALPVVRKETKRKEKEKKKLRRQRKRSLHQLSKERHNGSKSRESPSPEDERGIMWIRWVSGSTLLQGTIVMMRVFIFDGTSGRGYGQCKWSHPHPGGLGG